MPRKYDFFSILRSHPILIVCLVILFGFGCPFSSFLPYDFNNEEAVESVVFTQQGKNGTDSFGQLYLQGSSMVVIYQLKHRSNDTKHNRNYLVRRYASQGMKPNIRFWNLMWNISLWFELEELVEEDSVYWKRNISKLQLSQDENYIPGTWKYLVELGKGLNLFEKSGNLIIKSEEPLLNLEFGDLVISGIPLQSQPKDLLIRNSPCSTGVAAIVPVINTTEDPYSGCYFGVTHSYFSPSSITWYNLLHQSSTTPDEYSVCKENVFSKCSKLAIIDFALLNNQLLFLTTKGAIVSQNFTEALRNGSGTKLSFMSVSIHPDIDKAISMESVAGKDDMKLFHTPHCHRSYASDIEEVCIAYRNKTFNSSLTVCSSTPFDKWRKLVFENAPEVYSLLDLVHDFERESTVALMLDKSKEVSKVQVYNGATLSLPTFSFDESDAVDSLHFHGYTKTIYASGSQVWQSLDGGNSFHKVTSLYNQDRVTSIGVDLFGNIFCLTTELGYVLFGKAGIHRAIVIKELKDGSLSQPVYTQVIGHENTVVTLKVQDYVGNLSLSLNAFEIKRVNDSERTLPLSLLVSFRSETQVEFYANSEYSDGFPASLTGQVIYSRYGGSASITHVRKTFGLTASNFKQYVVGYIMKPFVESSSNITDSLLQVSWSGWNASLTLLGGKNTASYWKEEDVGKTVILPEGHSFLLTHYVNETTFIGLTHVPWIRGIPFTYTFEAWTIYDFRNPTSSNSWWVNEDTCNSVVLESRELDSRLYHLDSIDTLTFTATSISRKIRKPTSRVLISNPRLFALSSVNHNSLLNNTMNVLVSQRPSATGTSSITVLLQDSSLFCKSTSFTISIHSGCPPSKKLRYIYPSSFTDNTFLYSKAIDSKGIQRNFKLPYNYRPPSARGKAIPLTSNIYNVHPKQPHYRDAYLVTRETVRYKQCQGAKERTACGCTRPMRRSSLEKNSDCIDTVYRILFTEKLKPKFTVSRDERETINLDSPYYLKELNQRIDYEIIDPSTKTFPGIAYLIMEEKLNSSVEFIGSGLYHFRAYVVRQNYTFCELTDEFLVFVVDTPLPYPVKDIVMACTAMGFSSMLYLIYLLYFHGKKKIKYD